MDLDGRRESTNVEDRRGMSGGAKAGLGGGIIGIIIARRDNKYLIEYCSDKRIISREYKII